MSRRSTAWYQRCKVLYFRDIVFFEHWLPSRKGWRSMPKSYYARIKKMNQQKNVRKLFFFKRWQNGNASRQKEYATYKKAKGE